MKRVIGPLVFVVLARLSFGTDETYSLNQVRHVGDTEKFHRVIDAPGDVIIRYDSTDSRKVTKVDDNGNYTIEETNISGFRNFGGKIEPFPKGVPNLLNFNARGFGILDPQPAGAEFVAVNEVALHLGEYAPKEARWIGDMWGHGNEIASVTCILVGPEKVGKIDCLKISMTVKLHNKRYPGSAKATIFLRANDFSLEKMDAMVEGASYTSDLPMKMNKNHITVDRL
ncbi:MAG: hypothetical protein WCG75_12330 [Armatimonadota bacterium]